MDHHLSLLLQRFAELGLTPVMATEIEFYFSASPPDALLADVVKRYRLEKERGENQYEMTLAATNDIAGLIAATNKLKQAVSEAAAKYNIAASFAARPFSDQPGSGMHIHAHLEANGVNQFYKDDETISDLLRFSLGGLLAAMPESMIYFAPHQESYARFIPGGNVPTTISWGGNNRTVALRLPSKPHENKHIEHRVSGADADIEIVIAAILAGIYWGITHKLDAGEQIYGDASLSMYKLPKLPASLADAQKANEHGKILKTTLNV